MKIRRLIVMSGAEIEKLLKKKRMELLTLSEAIRELNLNLDTEINTIINTFMHSAAGLFLINKAALILLSDEKHIYTIGDDEKFDFIVRNDVCFRLDKVSSQIEQGVLRVQDLAGDEIKKQLDNIGIELIVPMFLRKELRGLYLVGNRISREAFSEDDMNFLFVFANQMIVTIENVYYFSMLQRHVEELTVFNEITAAINSDLGTELLLDMVLGALIKMLNAHAGFIIVHDQNKKVLFFVPQRLDKRKIDIILEGHKMGGIIDRSIQEKSEEVFFLDSKHALPQEYDIFLDDEKNNYFWFCRRLLIRKENINSVICLAKKEGEIVSNKNIDLFLTLTNQLIMIVLNARLYELAITDGLTGLYIHRYFEQRLSEEMSRARRYSYSISVIMIDVDHFKECNDIYGHQIGNAILKKIGSIISFAIRKNEDIPCRWGGDELGIILPETDKKGACVLAERIRKHVEVFKFMKDNKPISINISIGISTFPTDAIDEKDLISQADNSLYQAKREGGNRVIMYGESISGA